MNQKHLLRFIKRTIREDADTVCRYVDGKPQTLRDMFNELGVSAYDLREGFTVGIVLKMRVSLRRVSIDYRFINRKKRRFT